MQQAASPSHTSLLKLPCVVPGLLMRDRDLLQNCWCRRPQNIFLVVLGGRKFYTTQTQPEHNCACSLRTPRRREEAGCFWGFQVQVTWYLWKQNKATSAFTVGIIINNVPSLNPLLSWRGTPRPSEAIRISCKGRCVLFLTCTCTGSLLCLERDAWDLLLLSMKTSDGNNKIYRFTKYFCKASGTVLKKN